MRPLFWITKVLPLKSGRNLSLKTATSFTAGRLKFSNVYALIERRGRWSNWRAACGRLVTFGYDRRKNFMVRILKNTAPRYPVSSKTSSTDWGISSSSNAMVVSSCSVLTEMRLKKIQLVTKQTLGYLKMWLWCIRARFNRAKQLSTRQTITMAIEILCFINLYWVHDMGLDEHQGMECTITLNQWPMQTQCAGLNNRERPPPIIIHQLTLTSWVVAYERFGFMWQLFFTVNSFIFFYHGTIISTLAFEEHCLCQWNNGDVAIQVSLASCEATWFLC